MDEDLVDIADDIIKVSHDFVHDPGKGGGAACQDHGASCPSELSKTWQR